MMRRAFANISAAHKYVPQWSPPQPSDIERLQDFLVNSKQLLVLTGAGISTESGIPDYRSEKVGLYARTNRRPVQHADFIRHSSARQRYWARNYIGWPFFASLQPNPNHIILSDWEQRNKILWLVTQNVDGLLKTAGSVKLTELHGCMHSVMCLQCANKMSRRALQKIIEKLNPGFFAEGIEVAPDADVLLPDDLIQTFKVPSCEDCGGILKPEVVFFGDNVARPVVEFVFDQVAACDKMLVIGSSLNVYSGYRFIQRAVEQKKPVAILNCGMTKADHLIQLKVSAKCGDVLPHLVY